MHSAQKHINHVALNLDASSSMLPHVTQLIKAADDLTRDLALLSEDKNQETRISIYPFASTVDCAIFDMDVMRTPSMKDLYNAYGNTALIDAVIKSQQDLATTSQIYGDHAFLTFTLTDGDENYSRHNMRDLQRQLASAPDNWTNAFLVPNQRGITYLTRLGVSEGNIAIWDTASVDGFVEASKTIRNVTETFMDNRSKGIRGSRNLFSTGVDAVNDSTVKTTLTPLDQRKYQLLPVYDRTRIDQEVYRHGIPYKVGSGYYQLTKTETIQPQKDIIIVDKQTGQAYSGPEARNILGLPNIAVRVKPDHNPKYDVFVQSTSVNRVLLPNTKVLVRTG